MNLQYRSKLDASTGEKRLITSILSTTRRFTNANSRWLQNLLGSFDPDWSQTLESFLIDERKDAVDNIVDLRNTIAHGGSVGITYPRISKYYKRVHEVVERIADLCTPQ